MHPAPQRITILSAIWPGAIEQLEQQFACRIAVNPPDDQKREMLSDAEIAIVRSPVRLDRETLAAAPNLRLIVRAGAGLDAIDVEFAKQRGILLVAIPLSVDSVAEHAIGLLLAVARRIPWFHHSLQESRWEKHSRAGVELHGKRLGLLGFGRIGIRVAEIAQAFKMELAACDRSPEKPHKAEAAQRLGVHFLDLDELLATSDYVTIQTPLNDTTKGLIDASLLRRMKPTSILINVGRGGIIDEDALYDALHQGRLAGAGLDVFHTEPPGQHPLLTLDNFVATPHVAAQTDDAQRRVGEDVLRVIEAFAQGDDLSKTGLLV